MPETMSRSITAKIRFPKEFLAVVDEYATRHCLPRSVAVRKLIGHGLVSEEAKHASTDAQQPQTLAA